MKVITLRIPSPDFSTMSPETKKEIIEEISKNVAEQIYAAELRHQQQLSIAYWQQYLRNWDIEVLLAEIKHGITRTDSEKP